MSSSRIPESLQAVFLASNRGKEVYVPPPNRAANRSFLRNWIFQNRNGSSSNNKNKNSTFSGGKSRRSLFGDSQEKIKCLAKPELKKTGTTGNSTAATATTTGTTTSRNAGEKTKRSPTSSSSADSRTPIVSSSVSPQEFLDVLLKKRGYYSTDTYNTLLTAYYNKPTRHQIASYGTKMSELAKQPVGDLEALEGMQAMVQGGLSANPCNAYGESILHLVCRRGNVQMLQLLHRNGCNFSICDDYGRTPLHDTCWSPTPAFACVELLLQHAVDGPRLFYMRDRRGSLPLSYVHKDHYPAWIEFLDQIKDVYWPKVVSGAGPSQQQGSPELAKYGPNSRPLPNPKHAALPDHLCTMVANGRLTIQEAITMKREQEQQEARAKARAAQQLAAMLAAAEEQNKKIAAAADQQDAATANLSCDDSSSDDDDDESGSDSDEEDGSGSDDDDSSSSGSDDSSSCTSSDYDDSSSYDEDQLEADGLFDVLQMTKAYMSSNLAAPVSNV